VLGLGFLVVMTASLLVLSVRRMYAGAMASEPTPVSTP
jgi:hypothetical protein